MITRLMAMVLLYNTAREIKLFVIKEDADSIEYLYGGGGGGDLDLYHMPFKRFSNLLKSWIN